jgi:transposase-like protein
VKLLEELEKVEQKERIVKIIHETYVQSVLKYQEQVEKMQSERGPTQELADKKIP